MDKDISGVFIPAKTLAGGGFSKGSSVISEKQLEKLRKYTRELVTETAAEVKSGHFEADPLVQKDSSPCSYCEYSSVCGNYPNIISRKADPDAGEKMLAIISNDDDNKEE
jgi:ATP-dependent helicase/nuclease subunit B